MAVGARDATRCSADNEDGRQYSVPADSHLGSLPYQARLDYRRTVAFWWASFAANSYASQRPPYLPYITAVAIESA
jgi:hypothetical protein